MNVNPTNLHWELDDSGLRVGSSGLSVTSGNHLNAKTEPKQEKTVLMIYMVA